MFTSFLTPTNFLYGCLSTESGICNITRLVLYQSCCQGAQSELVCCLTSCHHGRFRFKDGEVSAPDRALACKDRKHFLFIPEASDSDGVLRGEQGVPQAAGNSCSSSDKWLLAEVFDIISADWQTWFGTLCVLLWLLYLIVL